MHRVHNLSSTSLLLIISALNYRVEPESGVGTIWDLSLKLPKFSEFTNTSIGSYFFARPRSISFTNFETLTTYALLTWVNC